MLELTGMGSVLRGIGVLYWLLAIGVVALAIWKGKTKRAKLLWAGVAVVAFGFVPVKAVIEQAQRNAYAKEAWAYFRKKCDTEAGEKIYKTIFGVKSVLVVKPLPAATDKDNYDQFWYGDPYSASVHSQRGTLEAAILASPDAPISFGQLGLGYDFVESATEVPQKFIKYFYPKDTREYRTQNIDRPISRFGVSWEDISTQEDRKYWVAASRLSIIDLTDNAVVAERIGYLIEAGFGSTTSQRRPWLSARGIGPNGLSCPETHTWSDRWFILRALRTESGVSNVK